MQTDRGPMLSFPEQDSRAVCYAAIQEFYGDRVAERSQVPLMNHIEEGIRILEYLRAGQSTIGAFCIHPMLQADADLVMTLTTGNYQRFDSLSLLYAMEYRNKANAYLCKPSTDDWSLVDITTHVGLLIEPVRKMLIADKVQNYKDFLQYHADTHARTFQLNQYFLNWMTYLGVSEEQRVELDWICC